MHLELGSASPRIPSQLENSVRKMFPPESAVRPLTTSTIVILGAFPSCRPRYRFGSVRCSCSAQTVQTYLTLLDTEVSAKPRMLLWFAVLLLTSLLLFLELNSTCVGNPQRKKGADSSAPSSKDGTQSKLYDIPCLPRLKLQYSLSS